jgi:hypothetical protein
VSIAEEVRGLLAALPPRAMLHLVTNCEGCEFELLEVLFLSDSSQARVFCHPLDKAGRSSCLVESMRACVLEYIKRAPFFFLN